MENLFHLVGFQKPQVLNINNMPQIDEEILNKIKQAAENKKQEIAGVIFNFNGLNFYQMPNKSGDKSASFRIDEKIILLKDKIHCFVHSHPESDAMPSESDKRLYNNHKIPLLIYSCIYDNFLYFDGEKCKPIKV